MFGYGLLGTLLVICLIVWIIKGYKDHDEGLSNQSIGERLNISVRTVEAHRSRIMLKLNLASVDAFNVTF
jgi:hypothetical protein